MEPTDGAFIQRINPTFLRFLRWAALTPCAFVSAGIAWVVVSVLNRASMSFSGVDPDGFFASIFIAISSHLLMGAAFVYSGRLIAPSNKKIVSYLLAATAVLISGFLAFPAVMQQNWRAIFDALSLAAGSSLVAFDISENKTEGRP